MKENTKQKILKYLRIILPITLIFYLYELTIGDYLSYGSLSVDYLFYYTTKSLFLFNLAGIALYFYCKQKSKRVKIISLIIFFPIGILVLLYVPINVMAVMHPHYEKYYFYEENGIKYYMISERLSALDGSELKIYKEKPIFYFIKARIVADEEKLIASGVDIRKIRNNYIHKYFP